MMAKRKNHRFWWRLNRKDIVFGSGQTGKVKIFVVAWQPQGGEGLLTGGEERFLKWKMGTMEKAGGILAQANMSGEEGSKMRQP